MTILDKLAEHARERVALSKNSISLKEIQAQALSLPKGDFRFEKALQKDGVSFICECKKASPSKGIIAEHYPYLDIAKAYDSAGADCISVLTEPKWFLGSTDHLKAITDTVSVPVIRKDFTVDPYTIYEAKLLGASAVLLICSILSRGEIAEYLAICDALGLSALVEAHDEKEIETALSVNARVIGVNNRNLKDFSMDFSNSANLRSLVPDDVVFVSESGVKSHEDVEQLEKIGVNAVLVGETLMRSADKTAMLLELRYGK
ncbi:MAG: indole-3-glycerol phosphate synthase TrpC [Ruminococcus sp.]|nr:indole-3-glycerol phosphate synthase TrpC [Ruminococcus sp.]